MSTDKRANRLIHEKSPYLLQHAYNPVNWYPWSNEAFDKAKQEDKPVLLSIGYSTCHWCHVMAKESFEDEEVADLLNKYFVSIKVDREERPDIDQIYMNACHAMTGQGGWPLTVFMTSSKEPFFAGTYFPKRGRWGRPGLIELIEQLSHMWERDKKSIISTGKKVTQVIQNQSDNVSGELDESSITEAYKDFERRFDEEYGGFGSSPKFPTPHNLIFLLRYWHKTKDRKAFKMVEKTLDNMAKGGIFDHVGFGFHRYSTDRKWKIPHFEKMLYDNALLAYVYTEAFEATSLKKYELVARKIFTYVLRDMSSAEGGFFSAEDADSEGEEGKFYVWSDDEVREILGEEDGNWFCDIYDISDEGNFEGMSIPNLIDSPFYESLDGDCESMEKAEQLREKLFLHRENRIHPHKDDKILTSWNGLMVAALAKGARVLKEDKLVEIAVDATKFIFAKLQRKDGRLFARYRDGHAAFLAYLDDYAFLVWGLLELYESTYDVEFLQKALEINRYMLELFRDEKQGGLFLSGIDSEKLIVRPKEIYDGALPSGNSVAALNLLKLSRITGDTNLSDIAQELFSAFAVSVSTHPSAHSFLLTALQFALWSSREIVIVGKENLTDTRAMLQRIRSFYMPNAITVLNPGGEEGEKVGKLIPFVKEMMPLEGKTTAYICENYICQSPTTDVEYLSRVLKGN